MGYVLMAIVAIFLISLVVTMVQAIWESIWSRGKIYPREDTWQPRL